MDFSEVLKYYSKPIVKREIVEYSRDRWVAVYAIAEGSGMFIRYGSSRKDPINFSSINEFENFLKRIKSLKPRTFYATVNKFYTLKKYDDVENVKNVYAATPIWDIDGPINRWEKIIEIAEILISSLDKEGVSKSVYLIWSGRGIHVQINEFAFSEEILSRFHPLDIAYSVVEYILRKKKDELLKIIKEVRDPSRPLRVENDIDFKRVFTTPLSLHKEVDLSAICFKPNQLYDFSLEWANPKKFRHNIEWRKYVVGEADELALKAIKNVGGYFNRVGEIKTVVGDKDLVKKERKASVEGKKIGRFQVMALLQAARYYLLTGDLNKAKSFGLNRAIFYAWAKKYGKSHRPIRKTYRLDKVLEIEEERSGKKILYLGNEGAYITDRGWFIIGDKEQLPEDFDREIADKIDSVIPFEKAWNAAINYVKKFSKRVLLDQQRFFKEVYEKVRDNFIEKVVLGKEEEKTTLLDFFKKEEK